MTLMVPVYPVLQVVVERSLLEQLAAIASIISSIAIVTLASVGILVLWRFRGTAQKVNALVARVQNDAGPLVQHANTISDNVSRITGSIRGDVERVSETVNKANDRLQEAIAMTEDRIKEFNALLEVVQQEAEDVFVSTAATVRGIRTGAAAFQDRGERGGPEFASDELDPAEVADEIERQLEGQEVGDGFNGGTQPSAETLPAAPRVRPRTRGQRRSG
jgi:hypothetical protein